MFKRCVKYFTVPAKSRLQKKPQKTLKDVKMTSKR